MASPLPDTHSALLIVGSGPAGLSAAKAYRAAGGTGPVRLVTVETHPPYDRPPLSKEFLRGESTADDLPLEDEAFFTDNGIELIQGVEMLGLSVADKRIRVSGERDLPFERCVLALGSRPAVPPIDGVDHDDVLMLRSLDNAVRLRKRALAARSAVVIGSGFIGCEAAVSLARLGLEVTVVTNESRPQVTRLGEQVSDRIVAWLTEDGVRVVGDARVDRIDDGRAVVLGSGERLPADLVLVAAGAAPRTDALVGSGLTMEKGRVPVDEHMATGLDGIFVAGDIAFAHNKAAGRRLAVEHWGDAEAMGAVAGTVAAGGDASWDEAPGFFTGIGDRWLQYASWGEGFDEVRFVEHGDAFTVWYGKDGVTVGVCTHDRDDDYDRGKELVEHGAPLPG